MNKPVVDHLLRPAEPFADYHANLRHRLDTEGESRAQHAGARVGISLPHESAGWVSRRPVCW